MTRWPEVRAQQAWYDEVRRYTLDLVAIRGVSPGADELRVAQEVMRLLGDGGLEHAYTFLGLDPVADDPYRRQNACAFLRGRSAQTLVLLGHIDTVDTQDYGPLKELALNPEALNAQIETIQQWSAEVREDLAANPGDWLFGRGVADMKSGVAVNIAVMRHFAALAQTGQLPLSLVFLAVVDEENESAGVLQAVQFLLLLREKHGLQYVGAINTDYTTALYPGDPHRYIYTGSVGKLLPAFLIIGRESHVGHPFQGMDANLIMAELIRDLSMNDALSDHVRGQLTAPPVTLHATDLKAHYDVQLPFAAYCYFNVLTMQTTPQQLLEKLCVRAAVALATVLQRVDDAEQRWEQTRAHHSHAAHHAPRNGQVMSYADLYARTLERYGEQYVQDALTEEWNRWPVTLDKRERCLHLVYRLWQISGEQGPAIVVYYAPPYYPHVAATSSPLHQALAHVCKQHSELHLVLQEYFPFLSDLSYLQLDPSLDTAILQANMPIWSNDPVHARSGSYHLPFQAIRELALPVANLGPYGRGAHQRDERVLMPYSFGVLPQLLCETIEKTWKILNTRKDR